MTRPRTPALNFLVKSKADAKPISKTQKYFFFMLHVIFALDFGFIQFKSLKNKVLMKLITFAQSSAIFICLAFIIFSNKGNRYVVWYLMDIFVFYIFSLSLIVSKGSYYDYLNDLHSFDSEIEMDSDTYGVGYKLIIWFVLNTSYRIMVSFAYCLIYLEYCTFPAESLVLYNISVIGLDTVLIVYTCIFYAAYLRLKRFTTFIENDGKDLISCQYIYKSLVEIIERTKKSFDVVIILTLVTNTIDVTVTTYYPFDEESESQDPLNMSVAYGIVAQELLLLFSPAFTAGLLAGQAEKLKLVLYDKLIKDKNHTKDIKRFVAYIGGRPLRFKVWRVVPLDWRLPIIVINISVTYLIVIIQFSHKY